MITLTQIHRLALLVCDTPLPDVVAAHGNYADIFHKWITASKRKCETEKPIEGLDFVLDAYDVVDEQYPRPESYDAIIISGSCRLL